MKRYQAMLILTVTMIVSIYTGVVLAENNVVHSLTNQEHLCLGMLVLE